MDYIDKSVDEKHPDQGSYEIIWNSVIEPEIKRITLYYGSTVALIPYVKSEIWNNYKNLNLYCRNTYMQDCCHKLDRHKVAACYMVAILNAAPIRTDMDLGENDLAINEQLAITVGLSIVRAFLEARLRENVESDEAEIGIFLGKISQGLKIPQDEKLNHGKYLENYANELRFSKKENHLSILAIAHELYLLEIYTLYLDDK